MMGIDSVAYHEHTVAGRSDDPVAAAAAYYASRGETPMVWGGTARGLLGLDGEVDLADYRAIFGTGGAHDPRDGRRLVACRRPGLELVVSPHKSVAELGVIGRAEDMHAIVDAERDATLAYLDRLVRERGGRRGRTQTVTPTGGLIWATSRHATTRAGDPQVHDHVLIANAVLKTCGRVEGPGHGVPPRSPPRRHRRGSHGRRGQGGRVGLWDRGRPGPIGTARGLGHRRHPYRGVRDPFDPLGPDHRLRRR